MHPKHPLQPASTHAIRIQCLKVVAREACRHTAAQDTRYFRSIGKHERKRQSDQSRRACSFRECIHLECVEQQFSVCLSLTLCAPLLLCTPDRRSTPNPDEVRQAPSTRLNRRKTSRIFERTEKRSPHSVAYRWCRFW